MIGLGKAALYFALYFAVQLAVSFAYGVVVSARYMVEYGISDSDGLNRYLTEALTDGATLILAISGVVILLALFLFFKIRRRSFLAETGIRRISPKSLLVLIPLGFAFNVFLAFFMSVLPIPQGLLESYSESSGILLEGNAIISALAIVVVAPILEEVIFRGLIISRLKRGMPAVLAIVISSAVFGLVHGNLLWMSYTFVIGLLLSYVYIMYRSVAASIIFHMTFNICGLLLSYINDENISALLTWFIAAAGFVFTVILLVLVRKQKLNTYGSAEHRPEEQTGGISG